MKELLDRLSSYNLFNYLLPGVLIAVFAKQLTRYDFVQESALLGAFVYYFLGLVVSRVGSLVIEPILKWLSFVKFAKYSDFVAVSKQDSKIDVLSEANNMYRTFCALFLVMLFLKLCELVGNAIPILSSASPYLLLGMLLLLFLYSYRKQTRYITERIEAGKHESR